MMTGIKRRLVSEKGWRERSAGRGRDQGGETEWEEYRKH